MFTAPSSRSHLDDLIRGRNKDQTSPFRRYRRSRQSVHHAFLGGTITPTRVHPDFARRWHVHLHLYLHPLARQCGCRTITDQILVPDEHAYALCDCFHFSVVATVKVSPATIAALLRLPRLLLPTRKARRPEGTRRQTRASKIQQTPRRTTGCVSPRLCCEHAVTENRPKIVRLPISLFLPHNLTPRFLSRSSASNSALAARCRTAHS